MEGSSGSATILTIDAKAHTGTRKLKDRAQYHYMAHVSAIAFDEIGQFATCQESLNDYQGQMLPNFFMGPTLYDSRLPLINSKQTDCENDDTCFLIHTDMLHESPLCMGIAHDDGAETPMPYQLDENRTITQIYKNVYWTFDGGNGQLVRASTSRATTARDPWTTPSPRCAATPASASSASRTCPLTW